jgi:hypothetical protein
MRGSLARVSGGAGPVSAGRLLDDTSDGPGSRGRDRHADEETEPSAEFPLRLSQLLSSQLALSLVVADAIRAYGRFDIHVGLRAGWRVNLVGSCRTDAAPPRTERLVVRPLNGQDGSRRGGRARRTNGAEPVRSAPLNPPCSPGRSLGPRPLITITAALASRFAVARAPPQPE